MNLKKSHKTMFIDTLIEAKIPYGCSTVGDTILVSCPTVGLVPAQFGFRVSDGSIIVE
jgi:hypothetical protein